MIEDAPRLYPSLVERVEQIAQQEANHLVDLIPPRHLEQIAATMRQVATRAYNCGLYDGWRQGMQTYEADESVPLGDVE
jgi:hypothetical protein